MYCQILSCAMGIISYIQNITVEKTLGFVFSFYGIVVEGGGTHQLSNNVNIMNLISCYIESI